MNLIERYDLLDRRIADNSLARGTWIACLLSTLAPECESAQSATPCPAEVMPAWLAYLTPRIDDAGTLEHWPVVVRRYAALVRRWHVLTPETWHRLDYRVRSICVREAMVHTSNATVLGACQSVVALCDRAASGGQSSDEEWRAAAMSTAAAMGQAPADDAAANSAAAAARSASAVWAARTAASRAVVSAAARRSRATAEAATAEAEAKVAMAEASDRIIDATLDAIDDAIAVAEGRDDE
jgi:hypothetical protein